MRVLRTPDDRFTDLPGWPYEPRYVEVPGTVEVPGPDGIGLRVAYVDEGPPEADPVLLLHGEPSWSYVYRHMIPLLVSDGHRVVAPDLVGFGRSDKPAERGDYTYARHVAWLTAALFDRLDLRRITLVCQDWGGLLGLRLLAEAPSRFARVVVANTSLPTGDQQMPEAFLMWREFARTVPELPVGKVVASGCTTALPAEVVAAYDAPFPDESYRAGARAFPDLVPARPDDPAAPAQRRAWQVLRTWTGPFLCAFSDSDPVTAGADAVFRAKVPGAAHDRHVTIRGAGHFLQEDAGPELARVVSSFVRDTPVDGGHSGGRTG